MSWIKNWVFKQMSLNSIIPALFQDPWINSQIPMGVKSSRLLVVFPAMLVTHRKAKWTDLISSSLWSRMQKQREVREEYEHWKGRNGSVGLGERETHVIFGDGASRFSHSLIMNHEKHPSQKYIPVTEHMTVLEIRCTCLSTSGGGHICVFTFYWVGGNN